MKEKSSSPACRRPCCKPFTQGRKRAAAEVRSTTQKWKKSSRELDYDFFPCEQGCRHAQRRDCSHHRARPDDEGMNGFRRIPVRWWSTSPAGWIPGAIGYRVMRIGITSICRRRWLCGDSCRRAERSQIAMSAMEDWGGEISEQNVPVLIVIEGLTMYLSETDVQPFAVIAKRFCQATVFVETMNPMVVKRFKGKNPLMRATQNLHGA